MGLRQVGWINRDTGAFADMGTLTVNSLTPRHRCFGAQPVQVVSVANPVWIPAYVEEEIDE